DILMWEEKFHVRINDKKPIVMGVAPILGIPEMIKGIAGNNEYLSPKDKLSLVPFFLKGFKDYAVNPKKLDQISVKEYARQNGVTESVFHKLLVPLSAGVYFLPPDRFSAFVFFGLFAPGVLKFYKMRIGAFLGGMTEVMCNPIGEKIKEMGGQIKLNSQVKELIIEHNHVKGVILENGEKIETENVILAVTLHSAKQLLTPHFKHHSWFTPLFELPLMPAVVIQIETNEPSLPMDITTFAPYTCLASFAEQSRTTFQESSGRLSIILSPPKKFLETDPEQTLRHVIEDAKKIGINLEGRIKGYRKINHHYDFHTLEPGYQHLRPAQKTPIPGLFLAGDYTQQPYFATMEGAVTSGMLAANALLREGG
ncbi:MAG TPA: FAD-dependent oxidoreductase, partial [Chondromyces sp.]|nr:FAD-dependent oxidoreductase [Chondromyces sp.]